MQFTNLIHEMDIPISLGAIASLNACKYTRSRISVRSSRLMQLTSAKVTKPLATLFDPFCFRLLVRA